MTNDFKGCAFVIPANRILQLTVRFENHPT
jgi:hypothetical protein